MSATRSSSCVVLSTLRAADTLGRLSGSNVLYSDSLRSVLRVAAIEGQGRVLAERIAAELRNIDAPETLFCVLGMDKDAPLDHPMELQESDGTAFDNQLMAGAVVIVVDDVLNSGRTLLHGVAHFLPSRPRHVGTCVLVDRIHRRFPVRADYVGQSLSTNLKAHISVQLSGPGPDVALLKD